MRIIPPRPAISFPHPCVIAGVGSVSGGDTTPNAFFFTDQGSVAPTTLTVSNSITVSGINAPAAISVSGTGSPAYDINGSGNFTSVPGLVNNGDTVRARNTSSTTPGNTIDTIVTIGGVSDTFSITTAGSNSLVLNWDLPTQNEDGSTLTDLSYIQIYMATVNDFAQASPIATLTGDQTSYTVPVLVAGTGLKVFWAVAVDSEGTQSDPSAPIVRNYP